MGVFDLNSDDPLKLSSIVGEVVVVEKSLITDKKGKHQWNQASDW